MSVVTMLGFGHMAWRLLRGDEEMEPGGSYSRQSFGRYYEETKPADEEKLEYAKRTRVNPRR